MIFGRDSNPERDLYYIGSVIISELKKIEGAIDCLELYYHVKDNGVNSLNVFVLGLDWLFILGSIRMTDNGKIMKCF